MSLLFLSLRRLKFIDAQDLTFFNLCTSKYLLFYLLSFLFVILLVFFIFCGTKNATSDTMSFVHYALCYAFFVAYPFIILITTSKSFPSVRQKKEEKNFFIRLYPRDSSLHSFCYCSFYCFSLDIRRVTIVLCISGVNKCHMARKGPSQADRNAVEVRSCREGDRQRRGAFAILRVLFLRLFCTVYYLFYLSFECCAIMRTNENSSFTYSTWEFLDAIHLTFQKKKK